MKDKSGLIVSVLLMLCGAYALLTTLRSGEEEIMLIGDMPIVLGIRPGDWAHRSFCRSDCFDHLAVEKKLTA